MRKSIAFIILIFIFVMFVATSCVERTVYTDEKIHEFREVVTRDLKESDLEAFIMRIRENTLYNDDLILHEHVHIARGNTHKIMYVKMNGDDILSVYFYSNEHVFIEDRVLNVKSKRLVDIHELDFYNRTMSRLQGILMLLENYYIGSVTASSEAWNNQPADSARMIYTINVERVNATDIFEVLYDEIVVSVDIIYPWLTTNGFRARFLAGGIETEYHLLVDLLPWPLYMFNVYIPFPSDYELDNFEMIE